ncbi:MAG: hypothetical protein ACKVI4_13945 [Actinomycetales bacterium]|tara:strand:- start:662 stop:1411 length:750 start_codon:yes stop_codon:yes gene_type:complete
MGWRDRLLCCSPKYAKVHGEKEEAERAVSVYVSDPTLPSAIAGSGKSIRWISQGAEAHSFALPGADLVDDAVSENIHVRIQEEQTALRQAVFKARGADTVASPSGRHSFAIDFPRHLEKLRWIMLMAKVELKLNTVNQTTGTGIYDIKDLMWQASGKGKRSAAVLQVERPEANDRTVWKVNLIMGGRKRMDVYALHVLNAIAWRFFGPNDRFVGDGLLKGWAPSGREVAQLAVETSMNTLTFNFLGNKI